MTTLHSRASIMTLPYVIECRLRYDTRLNLFTEFSTAANVFDAIGLLREGVVRRNSRFKIRGIGTGSFNEILDWLDACGYTVDGLRVPAKATRR